MRLRQFVFAAVAATLAFAGGAQAEWAPDGPLKIEIGFGAGGSTDTLGRALAQALEEQTGWDVIVENKPGGGGVAMFSGIAKSEPDGALIGIGVNLPILINLAQRGDTLPFTAEDFDYLATITLGPLAICAAKDAPFDDFAGLVQYARDHDGALIAIDAGTQEMILRAAMKDLGVTFKIVKNNSGAETIQSILGGHVDAGFLAGAHIPYLKSGDLKMLATATATHHGYAPEVPSLKEQGFNYVVEPYWYIAGPKGMAPEVKAALAKALDDAIHSDQAKQVIVNTFQSEPINLGPDGARDMLVNGLDDVAGLLEKAK